jgi:hypothetical protein
VIIVVIGFEGFFGVSQETSGWIAWEWNILDNFLWL